MHMHMHMYMHMHMHMHMHILDASLLHNMLCMCMYMQNISRHHIS